jgi:hypothetical protein
MGKVAVEGRKVGLALAIASRARQVAPVPVEELANVRRFEVLLRMPGPDGRPDVSGGTVNPPRPADEAQAAAVIARSDARPLDDVQAEVARRSGPIPEPEAQAQAGGERAAKGICTWPSERPDGHAHRHARRHASG